MNNEEIIASVVVIIILLCTGLYIFDKQVRSINDFNIYWSCMDGCYNMEEVIYGTIDPENETLQEYYQECCDKCFYQYHSDNTSTNRPVIELV